MATQARLPSVPMRVRSTSVLVLLRLIGIEILTFITLFIAHVLSIFVYPPEENLTDFFIMMIVIYSVVFISNMIVTILLILRWRNQFYVFTEDGISYQTGLFTRQEVIFPCNNVETIELEQDMVGKLCNFGTLKLYDPALKETIYLTAIREPHFYQRVIRERYLKHTKRPSSSETRIIFQQ